MTELKTKVNDAPVSDFINTVPEEQIRQDCWKIAELMQSATQSEAKMWGASIIGFGQYHYVYASGREADWMLIGFSPRKQNISLYIMGGFEQYAEILAKLGKFKQAKGCLYIKRLSDINLPILEELIRASVEYMQLTYPKN